MPKGQNNPKGPKGQTFAVGSDNTEMEGNAISPSSLDGKTELDGLVDLSPDFLGLMLQDPLNLGSIESDHLGSWEMSQKGGLFVLAFKGMRDSTKRHKCDRGDYEASQRHRMTLRIIERLHKDRESD
jgi:hypothetical protein